MQIRREVVNPSARFLFRQLFRYSVRYYGATVVTFCTAPNTIVAVVLLIPQSAPQLVACRTCLATMEEDAFQGQGGQSETGL